MRAVRLLLLGAALVVATEATGGEDPGDQLRRCAGIDDDADRLACFDSVAAAALARDAEATEGLKRYGTRREGEDAGRRVPHTVYTPTRVHIVGYVRLGARGRHSYVDSDGHAWPVGLDDRPETAEFPFDAEVIPVPESPDFYRVRRIDGAARGEGEEPGVSRQGD